jgi:hypothetical protein
MSDILLLQDRILSCKHFCFLELLYCSYVLGFRCLLALPWHCSQVSGLALQERCISQASSCR